MMTEWFARMDIAEMNLDKRDAHRQQRIAKGNARVRERGRIDQDIVNIVFSLMNTVDEDVLGVGLQAVERDVQGFSFRG